jgi:hypothetical protein
LRKVTHVLEPSKSLSSTRECPTIGKTDWSVSVLPDEELIRLASLSVQAMELAGMVDESESVSYLSLAAACNCELIIRRARVGMS